MLEVPTEILKLAQALVTALSGFPEELIITFDVRPVRDSQGEYQIIATFPKLTTVRGTIKLDRTKASMFVNLKVSDPKKVDRLCFELALYPGAKPH